MVASLCLIAVSAVLNFRMGYRSAEVVFDGWVYGIGAASADVVKAISPFMYHGGARRRDYLTMGAAALIFIVFTGYSFTAALGFAAEHRAGKTSQNSAAIERHQLLADELQRVQSNLATRRAHRSVAEVDGAIAAAYKQLAGEGSRTVETVSNGCRDDRRLTRRACAAIAKLIEERARSLETGELRKREIILLQQIADGRPVLATADPQAEAIAQGGKLVGAVMDTKAVAVVMTILLAVIVELGSGLGLYITTTPWRVAPHEGGKPETSTSQQFAKVETYILARIDPSPGGQVSVAELYKDYGTWASRNQEQPMGRDEFRAAFRELARVAGVKISFRNRHEVYQDVKLGP